MPCNILVLAKIDCNAATLVATGQSATRYNRVRGRAAGESNIEGDRCPTHPDTNLRGGNFILCL